MIDTSFAFIYYNFKYIYGSCTYKFCLSFKRVLTTLQLTLTFIDYDSEAFLTPQITALICSGHGLNHKRLIFISDLFFFFK